METAVIIERIQGAIAGNLLPVMPDLQAVRIDTVRDLLRPWSDIYPGIPEPDEDEGRRPLFGWGHETSFSPSRRQSRRPFPPPLRVVGSFRMVSPGLFASVKAIWDWYTTKGVATTELLDNPFGEESLMKFIGPLCDAVSGNWPMCYSLEDPFMDYDLANFPGFHLMLPHYTYEEEGAGVLEAFLSGAESIASILAHLEGDFEHLAPEDLKLIDRVGYELLVRNYMDYPGEKNCNLLDLDNWYHVYFGGVSERFPKQMETDWPIISGNGGYDADVMLRSCEDVQFCLAYADAYYEMLRQMPDPYQFETNDGGDGAEAFVHELCQVWRKTPSKNRPAAKKPEQPVNPLTGRPLSEVFQEEAA